MSAIIKRNKDAMKKFEITICYQDIIYQEQLGRKLVDPKGPFYTPISRRSLTDDNGKLLI